MLFEARFVVGKDYTMTLKQDWQTVKAIFRDANRKSIRNTSIPAALARAFQCPVTQALAVTEGHDYSATSVCTCGSVRDGDSFKEHLITVLDTRMCLRIPPGATGEGW